ncbi:MAG: hypothetical protein RL120_13900, partial [Gammaproteobacteria bacterium]
LQGQIAKSLHYELGFGRNRSRRFRHALHFVQGCTYAAEHMDVRERPLEGEPDFDSPNSPSTN